MVNQFLSGDQFHWTQDVRETISRVGFNLDDMIRAEEEDTVLWTLNTQRQFNIASAHESIREKSETIPWHGILYKSYIHTRLIGNA